MPMTRAVKLLYLLLSGLMISVACWQCYQMTHDLQWTLDSDFCREMSYVWATLSGHFGQDPSYAGEYMWYNPLLFSLEALIVRTTGLSVNAVGIQMGPFLNLLAPMAFLFMAWRLFGKEVALGALLSFLFLSTGELPGCVSATLSPWLFPVTFNQFIFYLNFVLCYVAFKRQKIGWFLLLGLSIGINFLGHTAPALMMILIMVMVQCDKIIKALKDKQPYLLKRYLAQSSVTFVAFLIASLPLLYVIVGKYHLNFKNRFPFEFVDGIFIAHNLLQLIEANLSFSLIVAFAGIYWFRKNVKDDLLRKLVIYWFVMCVVMYVYSTLVSSLDLHFNIHLPGTVPSFHYFFYLKALQSLFFGFGLVGIWTWIGIWFKPKIESNSRSGIIWMMSSIQLALIVALIAALYFPIYTKRFDFVNIREQSLKRASEHDRIDMYEYIVKNIPYEKVILSEDGESSVFLVLPTARKMVSSSIQYSNPYLNFEEREYDRLHMLAFLRDGQPAAAKDLFKRYNASLVLLSNKSLDKYKNLESLCGPAIYSNRQYSLIPVIK